MHFAFTGCLGSVSCRATSFVGYASGRAGLSLHILDCFTSNSIDYNSKENLKFYFLFLKIVLDELLLMRRHGFGNFCVIML